MADHSDLSTSEAYATLLTSRINGRLKDLALGLDPAFATVTNPPTNMVRWSSAANKWQKYNGTSWVDLATTYAISISGSAGSAATLTTGRTIALSGAATGTATSFNGSANITIPVTALDASSLTAGTVPDARITGTYTGFTYKFTGVTCPVREPSSGTQSNAARTGLAIAEYRNSGSATTGAIVFIAPDTTSSMMYQWGIKGMLYNASIFDLIVQGYRTTTTWSALRKISKGSADVQVRLAVTPDGKNCLILGDVGTVWPYPHIYMDYLMVSHTNGGNDSRVQGWTTALVTDLTGYTNITADLSTNTQATSITGNAATATALQTARTINGVSFNGTANITLPTVNDTGNQTVAGDKTFTGATRLQGNTSIGANEVLLYEGATGQMNVRTGSTAGGLKFYTFAANGDFSVLNGNITASGNITAYSDKRLKKSIKRIPGALAKVQQLNGVTFVRKDSGDRQTGLIAQDVLKVLPEAVDQRGEYLALAYGNIVGLLVEAIKELEGRVKELEGR